MPAVQTSYSSTLASAYIGMVANGEWVTNVISRIVDPASATPINFGDPVLQGASEQLVVSGNGNSGVFRGIAVRETTLPPGNNDQFLATNSIGVLTKGVIWVNASVAVTTGQQVYYTAAGVFTNVATSNAAVPNAVWDSSTSGAALAKIRLG
jgi:hypothetical protein